MAWPNPFKRRDENTIDVWGYTFQWTPEHLTREELHPLKYTYDELGEECLNRLDRISPPLRRELPRSQNRAPNGNTEEPPKRDLYVLLRDNAASDEKLGELWKEVTTVPEWVDWDQIARGQDVFYRYAGVAMTALAYQSLLGGMAAARVTEVLARTGGFSPNVARRRMYETTQHILQVTASLSSIQPGGAGHASSIRVRLLHAAVRRRIMALAKERPSYYSVEDYGIPINDLDCIATITTFSATLIWIGFPRQGIFMRSQEIEDYLALWRLVAYYVGTPTEQFSTPARARRMMESLFYTEINPSATSKILANNIILSLQGTPPAYPSRDFLNANARWLNGDKLADALELGKPGWYYTALVVGQCIFFMFYSYTYRSIPYLDRKNIAAVRSLLYRVIVTNTVHGLGSETNFDFQYVPQFDTFTAMGEYSPGQKNKSAVEQRNFRALVVAGLIVGGLSWASVKIGWEVVGVVRRYVF